MLQYGECRVYEYVHLKFCFDTWIYNT